MSRRVAQVAVTVALLAVALLAVAATAAATQPAASAASRRAQAPALSIQLTDDRDTVDPNTTVHQVVTLTNTGAAAVTGLLVITAPPYASIASAPGADVDGSDATWTVTATPGTPLTEELDVAIGQVPAGEQFVTTLATFFAGGDRPPTVRTADVDRLPGVPDPRSTTTSTPGLAAPATRRSSKTSGWVTVAAVAGTIAVVAIGGAIAFSVRRRRLARSRP